MRCLQLIVTTGISLVFILLVYQDEFAVKGDSDYHFCGPYFLCRCYNSTKRKEMFCQIRHLHKFYVDPTENWSWVEILVLNQRLLKAVPDLSMFTHLKKLTIASNINLERIDENSFKGLRDLEYIDIGSCNLTFAEGTIHNQTFKALKLRHLRLQQFVQPAMQDDYSFLLPVKDTLEELFIVGTTNLARIFDDQFPRLHTLSLGGHYCNLTSFSTSIGKLPLVKLNLKNCNIGIVSSVSFRPLAPSLVKLDISCNPINFAGLLNITQALMGGKLKILLADFVNHKNEHCEWNATSEYVVPTLEVVSLQANHINYFTLEGNNSNFMKNLKYFDISYNPLNGAAFGILSTACTDWFWCNQAIPHQLQFFGFEGITRLDWQACGDLPEPAQRFFSCTGNSHLFFNEELPFEKVEHSEYLDAYIFKNFIVQLNRTAQPDAIVLINNKFNTSFLPPDRIVRIVAETVDQHPAAGLSIIDIVNMTARAGSKLEATQHLVNYFCRHQNAKSIYKETMKRWVRLNTTEFNAWTDRAIDGTIDHLCRQEDWRYGLRFFTDKRFYWFFTNLTTVQTGNNDLRRLGNPNEFCNDVVFFPNNLNQIDLSYANLPHIACSNMSGLSTVNTLICRKCNNYGWKFTGTDFPALSDLRWGGNYIGPLVREGNLFKGFFKLKNIDLRRQHSAIKYFERSDTFSDQQHSLRVLDLDDSGIEAWNISLQDHREISHVFLRRNKIKHIEERYRLDLDKTRKNRRGHFGIWLDGNPFTCSCSPESLKFLNWLNSADVIYSRDIARCDGYGKPVSDFRKECTQQHGWPTWMIVVVSISSAVGVVVLAVLFFLRARAIRRNGFEPLSERIPLTVFISFSRGMTDDVNALKEMTQDRLILLSSVWDFRQGDLISESLSEIMANTKKFILVMTEDYFLDANAAKEFHLMDHAGLLKRENVILILTSANINARQLPAVLKKMIDDEDFLIWPTCLCASTEFKVMAEKVIQKVIE